jgi:hypothetical protein
MSEQNSLGGRVTLGLVGVLLSGMGVATVAYPFVYGVDPGLLTTVGGGVLLVAGAVAVFAAVTNPGWLDVEAKEDELTDAEMRERMTDDPTDDY